MTLKFLIVGSEPKSLINFRGPLIMDLIEKGIQVHVASPHILNTDTFEKLQSLGVLVHQISLNRTGINPINDIKTILQLVSVMRKIKPDYFLGYTHKPAIYGNLASWLSGIPLRFALITGLGYSFLSNKIWLNYIVKSLYKFALKNTHKVIFQNQDDEELFFKLRILNKKDKKSCMVNGSGVDLDQFKKTSFPKDMSFLLIARLLKDKGLIEYFKASTIVKEKYPDIIFSLVGSIDENPSSISKKELQDKIDSGHINYYGQLKDVRPAIAESSVYVLPSYREGTPRTVLEAMAMGRPIITTNAPGCRETVIEGENGYLVPIKCVDSLVDAILNFIENPKLVDEMGINSRKIAEQKYDVKKVNKQLLNHMQIK